MAEAIPVRSAEPVPGSRAILATPQVVLLLVLNVLDGLFTLTYLELGLAHEANPLMREAYALSPLGFMVFKLLVVNAGVWVLAAHWSSRLARGALGAATFAYAVIVVWHVAFLAQLLLR